MFYINVKLSKLGAQGYLKLINIAKRKKSKLDMKKKLMVFGLYFIERMSSMSPMFYLS